MLIEAVDHPVLCRFPGGEIRLEPGKPIDVPDERAKRLLNKAGNKVHMVTPIVQADDAVIIEPAHPQARPVYFERNDGAIYGPARVTDLEKVGTGATEQFWIIIEFHGQPAWVRSDRLRSKQAFDRQVNPKVVERIQEPR